VIGNVPAGGVSCGIGSGGSGGLNSGSSCAGTSTHGKDEGDGMIVSCADGYLHGLRGWVVDRVRAKAGLEPIQVLVGRWYGELETTVGEEEQNEQRERDRARETLGMSALYVS